MEQTLKPLRGERAKIVREGLKAGLDSNSIVGMVLERFPGETRKKVQTMISRYRQLLGDRYV